MLQVAFEILHNKLLLPNVTRSSNFFVIVLVTSYLLVNNHDSLRPRHARAASLFHRLAVGK